MIKNDTYEEIFEDQKFEDRKREIKWKIKKKVMKALEF